MSAKRNPIKQIMSEVHKDSRSGKVGLGDHRGFVAEVKRRVRAAGLSEGEMPPMKSGRGKHAPRDGDKCPST